MKISPTVANLRITTRCNNSCEYCYAKKGINELSFEEFEKVIEILEKLGVKTIQLTGGEPLIKNNIIDIFELIKSHNMNISLDTSCDYFKRFAKEIDQYVNQIGTTLDFPDSSFRNPQNNYAVIDMLKYYLNKKNRPRIKIATVVTSQNIKFLPAIGEILKNYEFDLWKLYEFIAVEGTPSEVNQSKFTLSSERYNKAVEKIEKLYGKEINIVSSKRSDRSNAYFFIEADGTVFNPGFKKGSESMFIEYPIGSIFDPEIITKWQKHVGITYDANWKVNSGIK